MNHISSRRRCRLRDVILRMLWMLVMAQQFKWLGHCLSPRSPREKKLLATTLTTFRIEAGVCTALLVAERMQPMSDNLLMGDLYPFLCV